MTQLVQQQFKFTANKFTLNDAKDLMTCADPILVGESVLHGIAFYEDMIFDANNEGTKKTTIKNIDVYSKLPCVDNKNPTNITIPPKIRKLGKAKLVLIVYNFYR